MHDDDLQVKQWSIADLKAGTLMSVILLVQGIAYAQVAHLPIKYGLNAALIGPLIYLIVGSTERISIGPVAIDALLMGTCISVVSIDSNHSIPFIAFHLVLLVGVIQLVVSFTSIKTYIQRIPEPVLKGFITGGAIAIVISQLRVIFNITSDSAGPSILFFTDFIEQGIQISSGQALGIFLLYVILNVLKKYTSTSSAYIIILLLSVFAVYLPYFELGTFQTSLPPLNMQIITFPIDWNLIVMILPWAGLLAIINFIEAVTIEKALSHGKEIKTQSNEMLVLGIVNSLLSVFQSMVVTGGLSRSMIRKNAGAKTRATDLVAAILLASFILFFSSILLFIPPVLISLIIISAMQKWISLSYVREQVEKGTKRYLISYMSAIICTLTLGIQFSIPVGIGFYILFRKKQ